MSDHKDMTHRHLRHKLQSLGRRLDELEEATNKLQKSEDELLDLQDKIIQAEGSNSSLLGDVEALRKRLLKIQGKDEEVRKAEDLCRTVREKLEEEESLTKELKGEVERLQRRLAELEKLEEAFAKSKSDCSQLCLSLNEEKNLTRKLCSEMETLKARLKEVEGSETKLDKAEQVLAKELEKLKAFTQAFVGERKRLLEKQREDEKVIQKLSEEKKSSRIEDELFSSKLAGRKNLDYLKLGVRKGGGLEGSQEEDNKVKELSQEVEKLKNRLKQLEVVEEDLKSSQFKNGELHERFQVEQRRARQLSEQVEQLRTQLCGKAAVGSPAKVLENGKAESGEEPAPKGGFRTEKPKFKSSAAPPAEARSRDVSPQQRRETKLRGKDVESSPKAARRALRTPRPVSSDNGVLNRFPNTSDSKKASVLSRYPPAANQQKPLRTPYGGDSRNRFPKPYGGSDSESNNSDALPESSVPGNDAASASDREPAKANGSYPAYRPHVAPPTDHASDSQSSASETESTGSRPSEAEPETRKATSGYARYAHNSLSGGSFDEELHAARHPAHPPPPSLEIQRVCSPREALTSKAVIKPAIVEIDRKELMISDAAAANGKPKISSKPTTVTSTSKMTSSITIYPSDPSSSRTSSRSSSVSSEPLPVKERHTSTSNILIGPSSDHRVSVPYEISIPKSEIALRTCQDQDCGDDDRSDFPTRSKLHGGPRVETNTTSSISSSCLASHQRSGAGSRRRSSDNAFADFNDTESGFESCSSSTTTVTSWRSSGRQTEHPQDDALSDMKNVTVRSTWRNRGAASVDEAGGGRPGSKASTDGGSEDEAEAATTWRAYRATTFDSEDAANSAAQRGTKHAEVYMRRYNSATSAKEAEEPALRRERSSDSPTMDAGILGRTIPHAPVTSQSWSRSYSQQPPAKDNLAAAPNPCLSPASWRRQQHLGSSYDRPTKTAGASWSGRGQASGSRTEGRAGAGSRAWSQSEHR